MLRVSARYLELALLGAIVGLTLATAYIHAWVGGMLLMLNAAGYVALAASVPGSALLYRRLLPLALLALAGYAAVTIVAWLVIGPDFDMAYIAKAIEIGLISTIAMQLWLTRGELGASIRWGRSLLVRVVSGLWMVGRSTGSKRGGSCDS